MSVPKEIGHLVLNVTDVERSTKFYRDVVGFEVCRYRPDGTGTFLTCGVVHHNLALFKAPEGAQPKQNGQIGLNHFAFRVESYQALQEAHKRLLNAGATIDHIVDHGMTRSKSHIGRQPQGAAGRLAPRVHGTDNLAGGLPNRPCRKSEALNSLSLGRVALMP